MFDTALLYLNVIFTRPVQYPVDYNILLKTSCDDYTILHVPVCIYIYHIYIFIIYMILYGIILLYCTAVSYVEIDFNLER